MDIEAREITASEKEIQMKKKQSLIMKDYAHHDSRSVHAMLNGYGDGREKLPENQGDLGSPLASRDAIKDTRDKSKSKTWFDRFLEGPTFESPEEKEEVERLAAKLRMGVLHAAMGTLLAFALMHFHAVTLFQQTVAQLAQ